MPLSSKGREIMRNMKSEYGEKKGESVFYASKNAGKISGVDARRAVGDLARRFRDDEAAISEQTGRTPPSPVTGIGASSRERGMAVGDFGSIHGSVVSATRPRPKTYVSMPKPQKDELRERLPKVMQLGTTWGTGGGRNTWQPYDARDARAVVAGIGDARRVIARIVDASSARLLDLGVIGGNGVPMSGWTKAAGPPAGDEEMADKRHFFKGSKDARAIVRAFADAGDSGVVDPPGSKKPWEPEIMKDEHLGFAKLKSKLAHRKGVKSAGALAAYIGREKYGKAGMEKKAEAHE